LETLELLGYRGARQLFETLRRHPQRQFSINELSKTAHLPFTTTWKLVGKFELAQLLELVLIGKTKAVRFRKSPYSNLVLDILRKSASMQKLALPELKKTFKAKNEVTEAYVFGSVALGKEKLESDIDVALLIKRKMDLPSLISSIYDKYGVKLMPLVFYSRDEFEVFLKDKKKVKLV